MSLKEKKYISFYRPDISDAEIEEVIATLKSGWLAKGPKTIEFEEKFAQFVGAKHAIGMNSCTAALHISLLAAGIGAGDEVITTPMTFAATVNTIIHTGAKPVLVDIESESGCIDVNKIEEKITKKTKAIVPVHYGGQACDLDRIYEIADKYGLFVSEDAAHALYTRYKGRLIGNKPKGTVSFSFYATKNLCTGEGGMLVTDNDEIAEKARVLSLHGMSKNAWNRYAKGGTWKYDIEYVGFKYNMFDLQAALGIVQLKRIEEMQKKRERIAQIYEEGLKDMEEIELPKACTFTTQHSWHLYIIKLKIENLKINRDEFIDLLKERGIGTSVHFIPLYYMSAYKDYNFNPKDFPNTEDWWKRIVSLPLYPTMCEDEVVYVVENVRDIIKKHRK
ncbi:DegT/DnrJ/EryC1/StrS family aminotransferase [Caldicellulosiruptor acetigenus]|uniref:DegT/DnrJ/EryC1/StrS aminotransferase n=1 Tax=Caldicellulosiruptor acetigenus 6A TaxID=632516 RepID=G2PWB1_9FIRM|nr:DegT/DnrJ/EryC1/StrS aminotransferase family protein [Caldicellulosiruptor acetigenus]AEM72855.1 DegT/DnrJ/EryC1/StrS aminotransferase [Caldicellulosiruptor acetigenus 6A]